MTTPLNEPTTADAVAQWIEQNTRSSDRFGYVAASYEQHRLDHGCFDVYPYPNCPLLGTLAASSPARRLLEVGCGLGYGGLWLAYGPDRAGFLRPSTAMTGT